MAILQILHYPDPRLRNVAEPVAEVTDEIKQLVDDMFETMYSAEGIGLASIQVNVPHRVITIDTSRTKDQPLTLINPEILASEGTEKMQEGCLSFPGVFEPVQRAAQIKIRALDREGQTYELDADGLLAVCIQHEMDHLDGKMIVDYQSPLKRKLIRRKVEKIKRRIL